MRKLLNDEAGFVISAELILVLTIAVLGMVVGLASMRDSLTNELNDLSAAFGALDQTYNFRSISKGATNLPLSKGHGQVFGSGYKDFEDDCDRDCQGVRYTDVCGKPDANSGSGSANEGNQ